VLAHVAPHAPQLSTSSGHDAEQPEPTHTTTVNASITIAHPRITRS
jgi:hypothetical protein